jgi:hypothetical protein
MQPFNKFLLGLAGLVGLATSAQTQYTIDWFTIDSGGGTSSGGGFEVSGTIGQPDAGTLSGGGFVLEGGFWAGAVAVQIPGRPLLTIERNGPNVVISWLVTAQPFALESRAEVASGIWSPVAQQAVTNNGAISVTLPLEPGNRFYRLQGQ